MKKWMKYTALALSAAFITLAGFAAYFYENLERYVWPNIVPPASYWVDGSKPLREQTVRVEIGGRVFNIPQMYIDSKLPLNGVIKDSVLLNVVWPEMQSLLELKTKENYQRVVRKEHRSGDILLEAQSDRPSLDTQIASTRQFLTKEEFVKTVDGLEMYLHYHGPKEKPELWSEMYLEKDANGHVVSYNECRLGRYVLFPGCSHKFIDGKLIYQISYNKEKFFSEWRDQRRRAIDFMNALEVTVAKSGKTGE